MSTCTTIKIGDQTVKIRTPGGNTIQPLTGTSTPSNLQIVKNLLSQASSVLSPLTPVFNIIEAVIAIKDFAEAVPKLITQPNEVVEAVKKLVKSIDKLISLIPQLSVPLLIVDIIDVTIVCLNAIVEEYEKIITQANKIDIARQRAINENNSSLLAITVCADTQLDTIQLGVEQSLEPLNSLFVVMNIFLQLIGQDPIPSLSVSDDAEDAIDNLEEFVKLLTDIRNAIPIP
jgi:hypothetical protein